MTAPREVVVVGGGFAGACTAIQLVRRTTQPLHVTIIDPAEHPGRGLAYRTLDPDHRLNAPSYVHSLMPDDAWHLSRWVQAEGLLEQDPQARRPDGGVYLRRGDFGRYIEQTLQQHGDWPATGSHITHLRDTAVGLSAPGDPLCVTTAGGRSLPADLLFVATGNPLPRLQRPFDPALATHHGVIENALDNTRLNAIDPDARVLLVGAGLTALDVLSTLLRRGHQGEIVVVSRRGLRPRPQGPVPPVLARVRSLEALSALPGGMVLARIAGAAPAFMTQAPATARAWVRALRRRIAEVQAEGGVWYQPFDDLRDAVWQLWPTLPAPEKARFLRKLRTWYDTHRFRSPPHNQEIVDAARDLGRIRFVAGRLQAVAAAGDGQRIEVQWKPAGETAVKIEAFDAVVNCTGLDAVAGLSANPFLVAAGRQGWIRPDACGLGFEVDAQCRAVGSDGSVRPDMRLVGPPTVGSFGDPIGAMFIAAQIHRMLPDALLTLG